MTIEEVERSQVVGNHKSHEAMGLSLFLMKESYLFLKIQHSAYLYLFA